MPSPTRAPSMIFAAVLTLLTFFLATPAAAVPNLHSNQYGVQFKHTDLFAGRPTPPVLGHGRSQVEIVEMQQRYGRLRGAKKFQRMLECQDECERIYSLASPLFGGCARCCRELGVSIGYC